MSHKENMGSSTPVNVKPEPQEARVPPPLAASASWQSESDSKDKVHVKSEQSSDAARVYLERGLPVPSHLANGASHDQPGVADAKVEDAVREEVKAWLVAPESKDDLLPAYTRYSTANEIDYNPEAALKEGLRMVESMKASIKTLELGSKMRSDVWAREIAGLEGQGAPSTMIAVCGATGAGKSSTLNAILDDNIVPTSGMRACTAVVTEISYHDKKTIDGDVSFLSEAEWRQELTVLLDDLVDEDGNVKRSTDLRSDAGVAWSKVNAVYPSITHDMLAKLTVDQIIARDPRIKAMLGTTKKIVAKDSKQFSSEIAKYIDSKEKKRGDKKKSKEKEKEDKSADKSAGGGGMMAMLMGGASKDKDNGKKKQEQFDPDGPAYWPLIRLVQVRCKAMALRTGSILVDLPGVADANAARNSIAKDYMKKCDCIWILAPITRAVDDKTARDLLGDAFKTQLMMDGNYDPSTITFIATKCDDISCSEVIPALGLQDDPVLEEIEERLDQCTDEAKEWKERYNEKLDLCKNLENGMKQIRDMKREYEYHLNALENGEPFVPKLTAKGKKKRKNSSSKSGSAKKRRAIADDDSDADMDDDDDYSDKASDAGSNKGSDDEDEGENEEDNDDAEEEVTEESLKTKIEEAKGVIKTGREQLNQARLEKKEASDKLAEIKKREARAQKDKNALCSMKRSEYSKGVLKEDFRNGLKVIDDEAEEKRNPETFDPTKDLRDYSAIDLPVFTVSSRDYVRIKKQVSGDGDSTCFDQPQDTGIPDLQLHCHALTVSSRERAARGFLLHIRTFANQVKSYVQGIGDVTAADRALMQEKWESSPDAVDDDGYADDPYQDDPFGAIPGMERFMGLNALHAMEDVKPAKVDAYGESVGITPRLVKEFRILVDKTVSDMNQLFKDGLEEKCEDGAREAAAQAVETSDAFAASMHWATYRATLRRHGEWRRDLNAELIAPMTRQIATSWAKVFETDMFAAFQQKTEAALRRLVEDMDKTAAVGLKDRLKLQGQQAIEDARLALKKAVQAVKEAMTTEQKEISRCLSPHIQDELRDAYNQAMLERGTGSVARQKALFRNYVNDGKEDLFNAGSDLLFDRLAKAAEAVGATLHGSMKNLAQQVEVNLSVLWEGMREDPEQVRARAATVTRMSDIMEQIRLWGDADKIRMEDGSA